MTLQWSGRRLIRVQDANARGLSFSYTPNDDTGVLTSVQDCHSRTHLLSYSTAVPRKLTGVTVASVGSGVNQVNYPWTFSYENSLYSGDSSRYHGTVTGDLVTQKTEPGGDVANYYYEAISNPVSRTNSADWDGRVEKITWPDTDSSGILFNQQIQRNGNQLVMPGGLTLTYTYSGHDLERVTDEQTHRFIAYTYDNLHNVTSMRTLAEAATAQPLVSMVYEYGADGHTIVKETVNNLLGEQSVTTFTNFGLPLESRRKASASSQYQDQVTHFDYDAKFNLIELTEAYGTPDEETTSFAYPAPNSALGDLDEPIMVNHRNTWYLDYDATTGMATEVISPPLRIYGNRNENLSYTTEYNADGTLSRTKDPKNHQEAYTYGKGSLCLDGGPQTIPTLSISQSHVEDGVGDASSSTFYDLASRPVYHRDENVVKTRWSYTAGGNLRRILQDTTFAAADALSPTETQTTYYYNTAGQLRYVGLPKYLNAGQPNYPNTVDENVNIAHRLIRFSYERVDQSGIQVTPIINENLVTEIATQSAPGDANGVSYVSEYFGYDDAGQLAWQRRQDGTLVVFHRDALHRIESIDYPGNFSANPSVPAFTVSYTYDEFGRIATMSDQTGIATYTYDARNRIIQVTGSGRETVKYHYGWYVVTPIPPEVRHVWVRQTTVEVGASQWVMREDGRGNVMQVIDPFGQSTSYTYDEDGKVQRQQNSNGTWTTYTYEEPRDFLATISHWRLINGSEQKIAGYTYARTDGNGFKDEVGRVLREIDHQGATHSFTYDPLGRLTKEKDPDFGTRKYSYDARGNRIMVDNINNGTTNTDYYNYDYQNRLLWVNRNSNTAVSAGYLPNKSSQVFSYDAAGRVVRRERRLGKDQPAQVHSFAWDQDDRLRQVSSGAASLFSATYDGNGTRLSRTDSLSTRSFQYAGDTLFRETGAPGGDITHTPGVGVRSGVADRTFHNDWLGSARYTTDATAATTGRYAWDAYGQRSWTGNGEYSPGSMQWGAAWGYQTEPATASDAGVGLVLMGQRYYDPEVGRFMSEDPIGVAGGLNRYSYCWNNPVSLVDRDGRFPFLVTGAAGALTGGLIGGVSAWYHHENIGRGMLRGAAVGGVVGLTGGLVGTGAAALVGGNLAGGVVGGALGGAAGDAAGQFFEIRMGWRQMYEPVQTGFAGLLGGAAGAMVWRPVNARNQVVTHWDFPEQLTQGLQSGQWVQIGNKSWLTRGLTGILRRYRYSDSITETVPGCSLKYPTGVDYPKGLFGQRMYRP